MSDGTPSPPGRSPHRRAIVALVAVGLAALLAATLPSAARTDAAPSASPRLAASGGNAGVRRELLAAWRRTQLGGAIAQPRTPESIVIQPIAARRQTQIIGSPCGTTVGLRCADLVVPLDRSGVTPGTVTLKVQTLPSVGPERGVIFLIAGGPGQGSATVFGLDDPETVAYYDFLFPGYTMVAFDNRGTGGSALIRCQGLQSYYPIEQEPGRVAACAEAIGPNRVFYATRDHAEDLDAVRQALGVEKVALWGTSYGTKLSLAYALAHPGNVERLLLDSMVPTDLDDPFRATSLRELPKALQEFCGGGLCRSATADFAGDTVTVANRLAAKPAQVKVLTASGARRNVRVTGLDLLSTIVEADLNPGLAAELPAVMHAARTGDLQPLGRMVSLATAGASYPAESLSGGLFAATVCNDGPLPWPVDAPVAGRVALYDSAVKALPAGTLGLFGGWAAAIGNGHFCLGWPQPSGGVALGAGPLPNVPVLAVNGGFDMRTPTASAVAVISKFPQGRLIVVPSVGHSVLGADPSFCSARAVREWMLGNTFSDQCARPSALITTVPAYPTPKTKGIATPAQTLAIAAKTLREAEAVWFMAVGPGSPVAGLYGGKVELSGENGLKLTRYSIAPGIEVSGTVRIAKSGFPLTFAGFVTVAGKRAAAGVLGLEGSSLSGTLGGVLVG
jgi:pimeloyl-ACP methyl ester carboxylesterase